MTESANIFLATVSVDSIEARLVAINRGLHYLGIAPPQNVSLKKLVSGKSYLEQTDGQRFGCSISRTHTASDNFTMVGITTENELGIDVEAWPKRLADPHFLSTVASPEDAAAVRQFEKSNHDAAIALWAIKEAALKCSGDVMTDPRNLALTSNGNGSFRVLPSLLATAPHPEIDVTVMALTKIDDADCAYLVAIALPKNAHSRTPKLISVHLETQTWQVSSFAD
jgi:phosphopantetheinyl transferase